MPASLRLSLMRTTLTWALALMLAALPLAACRAAPAPAPATITFAYLEQDTPYYQELARTFSLDHPSIAINLLPRPAGRLGELSFNDVDVMAGSLWLGRLIEEDDILSLSPWIEGNPGFALDDYYPGLLDLYTREGKLWAVPTGADLLVLYYNRDLCDRAGAPYPRAGWTWDDFLAAALILRDEQAGVYGYAAVSPPLEALLFAYQHGGRILDDWQRPSRPTLDDPRTVEALDWYAGLVQRHGVAPSPEEMEQAFGPGDEYALAAGIVAGRVAMWAGPYAQRGGLDWRQPWAFKWGMAPLPQDERPATWGSTEGLAISATAEDPEACWQWVQFLSRQAPSRLAPARRSVAESDAFARLAGSEAAEAARTSLEHALLVPPDAFASFEEVGQLWMQAVDETMRGEATAREALTRAQAEATQ